MKALTFFVFSVILFCYHPKILANEIDLFSSSRDIEHLFKDEEQLQFMMQEQLIAVQKQVKILDWFLDTFYGEGYENYTEADAEEYVSNPINTYCLLKRTALHWPRVKEVIFNDTVDQQMEDLIGMMNKTSQPPALNGAFSGLFSMQQMYNLDIKELSTGRIRIPGTNEYLTDDYELFAKDLQDIGNIAYEKGFYDRAYAFYMAAEWKANKDGGNQTDEIPNIKAKLKDIIATHDKTLLEKGYRGENWTTYRLPLNENLRTHEQFNNIESKDYTYSPSLFSVLEKKEDLRDQFNMLCRGEKIRTAEHDKKLKCYLVHNGNAYLRFSPFKVEEVNHAPYVAIFHDFLKEEEIGSFISAMPANKTKTMEEIEKESDMSPEFEFDPILDIIKEADEKLKLIKTTSNKNEKAKVKKGKSSKGKVTKGKKGKVSKNKDDRETSIDAPNDIDSSQAQKSTNDVSTKSTKKGTLEKSGDSNINSDVETKAKSKSKGNKTKKRKSKKEKKAKRRHNKISQRISLALRLRDSKLDDTTLKVEDLGIGGSYDSNIHHNKSSSVLSHTDKNDVQPTAASFLIHLTSSEAGGATIFPNLGITIWPKRGNAIFWHRTDERGNLDPVMSHGSCAVLHGMNLGIKRIIGWNEVDNQTLQTIKT